MQASAPRILHLRKLREVGFKIDFEGMWFLGGVFYMNFIEFMWIQYGMRMNVKRFKWEVTWMQMDSCRTYRCMHGLFSGLIWTCD